MKNTDINNVQFADNEVVALLWGDNLVYRKLKRILAGKFASNGSYTYKLNNRVDVPFELNSDSTFSQNVEEELTNCNRMFYNLNKLQKITSFPSTKNVTDMCYMFSGCNQLAELDMSNFDTSNVTLMEYMFRASGFEKLSLNINTSKVTSMAFMFRGCSYLEELDLSNFDTSNVTAMQEMFCNNNLLKSLDISNFDISNLIYMSGMFKNCDSLVSLDISSFDFTNVRSMNDLFNGCNKLETLQLGIFNTVGITNNDYANIFSYCYELKDVTAERMNVTVPLSFYHCTKLSHDSVMLFINGLAEISDKKSITFRKVVFDTLTDEEIALATSRGWSVVSA